jgi:uncharacterized protein YndB with AHSA1/START domain
MDKKKLELEFPINSSVKILYQCLSTSSGLSEWFADDVTIKKEYAKFVWEGQEEEGKVIAKKTDQFIRFQLDEYEDTDIFFEFAIKTDPLTGDVALIITDFVDEDEEEEQIMLWETQVNELRHILGG